jgi:cystathionine beta-lyase/cystathionine gamma-synthase
MNNKVVILRKSFSNQYESTMPHTRPRRLRPQTLSLNAGLVPDAETQAIAPNVVMSVNHCFQPGEGTFSANGQGDLTDAPYSYAGWTNPTVRQLEQRLAALEASEDAYATASGMAAISAVFLSLLKSGDHLIMSDVCYAGSNELALHVLPSFGIEVSAVNLSNLDELRAAIKPNTRLVHAETPCNPLLRLTDLAAVSEIIRPHNILLCVDSTFATPVITKPIIYGANLVIHSLTKFINGHGDALGGCVIGQKSLIETIRSRAGVYLGSGISAYNAWLIMRGIDTLYPRIKTMCESAQVLAQWLGQQSRVVKVIYPGLASHPQHQLAQQQMDGYGAILVFQVNDMDLIEQRFANEAQVFHYAFSIGHQRSLAVLLKTDDLLESTYRLSSSQRDEYLSYAGDGLFRLSVGLEDVQDLIDDLSLILK